MITWLDTETKALLQRSPPKKLAPSDIDTFGLVLLAIQGQERERLTEAIGRVVGSSPEDTRAIIARPMPITLKQGLSYEDALLGQFELICCDAVSVFLADEVIEEATQNYLADLYGRLLQSQEFQSISIRIEHIPSNDKGEEFLHRFVGRAEISLPLELEVMCKKARIMKHWAPKIGGRLTIMAGT
jgi:hypothetical protein